MIKTALVYSITPWVQQLDTGREWADICPGRFMLCGRASAFCALAVVAALTLAAAAQSVISTHSGIIHFFEGAVYLGDQALESHPGTFSRVPQGAELRTKDGRAEVLLTPGVFLRIGENSAIRMLANELSNTRVELLAGSAVVDATEPSSGTSVTLIYKNWSVHCPEKGVYRIDFDPPRLWALQGKAEVSADGNNRTLSVGQGMVVAFAPVLTPQPSMDQPHDGLSSWTEGRQQSISTDNAIAANIQDPASMDAPDSSPDTFTYYPALGLSSLGPDLSNTYRSAGVSQPGFNALYLPGYSFLPLLLGFGSGGFPTPLHRPPHHLPPRPGAFPFPGIPTPHPIPIHPVSSRPVAVHPVGPAIHVGGHR